MEVDHDPSQCFICQESEFEMEYAPPMTTDERPDVSTDAVAAAQAELMHVTMQCGEDHPGWTDAVDDLIEAARAEGAEAERAKWKNIGEVATTNPMPLKVKMNLPPVVDYRAERDRALLELSGMVTEGRAFDERMDKVAAERDAALQVVRELREAATDYMTVYDEGEDGRFAPIATRFRETIAAATALTQPKEGTP